MATRGVLFDVDGTLVDSGYVHTLCWWQALRQQGRDAPMATIHRAVGMGSDRLIPHVLNDVDDVLLETLTASHDALYSTYRAGVRCIGLECGGTSAAELREAGAHSTYRDPADLTEHWDATPLADH